MLWCGRTRTRIVIVAGIVTIASEGKLEIAVARENLREMGSKHGQK